MAKKSRAKRSDDFGPEQVKKFFANLQESVLKCMAEGTDVYFKVENDFEDIKDYPYYGDMLIDRRYTGCTYVIKIGLPAKKQKLTEDLQKLG